VLLKAFLKQFGSLGDDFLAHFTAPFLIEEGRLAVEQANEGERNVFYLFSDTPGKGLVVSRKAGGDVHIDDKNVSSRHAEFRRPTGPGAPWTLTDLGSTNGTYLNGEQLQPNDPAPLNDDAVIGFGPSSSYVFLLPHSFLQLLRLKVKKGEIQAPSSGTDGVNAGETMIGAAVALDPRTDSALPRRPRPAPQGRQLLLVCEPFEPIPLSPGTKITIGRNDAHADMVLPHPLVSRRHAQIECRPDGVYLKDFGSANGTLVGKHRVGTEEVEILPGMVIRIADFKLTVRPAGPGGAQAPEGDFGKTMVAAPAKKKKPLLRGDFKSISLGDLLVGIEEKHKSGSLEVHGRSIRGRIAFHAGQPVVAEATDGTRNEEAIKSLLKVEPEGKFTLNPAPRKFGERQIKTSFSSLVLEDFLG